MPNEEPPVLDRASTGPRQCAVADLLPGDVIVTSLGRRSAPARRITAIGRLPSMRKLYLQAPHLAIPTRTLNRSELNALHFLILGLEVAVVLIDGPPRCQGKQSSAPGGDRAALTERFRQEARESDASVGALRICRGCCSVTEPMPGGVCHHCGGPV